MLWTPQTHSCKQQHQAQICYPSLTKRRKSKSPLRILGRRYHKPITSHPSLPFRVKDSRHNQRNKKGKNRRTESPAQGPNYRTHRCIHKGHWTPRQARGYELTWIIWETAKPRLWKKMGRAWLSNHHWQLCLPPLVPLSNLRTRWL